MVQPTSNNPIHVIQPREDIPETTSPSTTHNLRSQPTIEDVEDEDMPSSSAYDSQSRLIVDEAAGNGTPRNEEPLKQPSEYLRKRCPLCFGGEKIHDPSAMYVLE